MAGPSKRPSRAGVARERERERRLAEAKAAQAARERGRRVRLALAGAVAVLLVIGVLVVVKVVSGGGTKGGGTDTALAPAAVVTDVTTVPASALDTVGAGSANTVPRRLASAHPLTADGKPRLLYVGGEYCPFCAAQRWAVVVALSRFGTWSNLGATESASGDSYPSTQTLSFHGATYTSQYLAFTGVETSTNKPKAFGGGFTALDTLTPADRKTFDAYDLQKYTNQTDGGIPFLDLGGRYVLVGSSYDPALLKDKTREQIAAVLKDPTSDIAKAVDGSANVLTAAICELTDNQPAQVCSSSGVTAAAKKLPTS